jgi:hypothetical protein
LLNNIGSLSSLTKLSLQESSISLKSLDLSDCKWLECIPELPPHLNQFLEFDCSSINRVVRNSRSKLLSDSKEGTFKFHFTNSQQLDEASWKNIGFEAGIKITYDAYIGQCSSAFLEVQLQDGYLTVARDIQ